MTHYGRDRKLPFDPADLAATIYPGVGKYSDPNYESARLLDTPGVVLLAAGASRDKVQALKDLTALDRRNHHHANDGEDEQRRAIND
jgi:hypothetical protein